MNPVAQAPVLPANFVLPTFRLTGEVYDFDIPHIEEPFCISHTFSESFSLNIYLVLHIFEFLFQDASTHQEMAHILQITRTAKIFYLAGHIFMALHLRPFKVDGKSFTLNSALFVSLSGLKERFSGLLNRPIKIQDLLEIVMAAKLQIYNDPTILKALRYLHDAVHGTEAFAINEFGIFRESRVSWLPRAFNRIFRYNQLPYAAEMYLRSGFLSNKNYFINLLDMNPNSVKPLLERFLAIPQLTVTFAFMIGNAVGKKNLYVLNFLLAKFEIENASFIENSNFLIYLVRKNALSAKLLELSRGNQRLMEASLDVALGNKNLEIFTALLEAYDFESLKWLGCRYLLSRRDDHVFFYNHQFFVDTFIADNEDIDIYPLLMPIFNLSLVHFKEIFIKIVQLNDYDFSEPKEAALSLFYHVVLSTENYLSLLPSDVTMMFRTFNDSLAHVREIATFTPESIRNLFEKFKNPLDLLYFSSIFSDLRIIAGSIHLFDLNRHFVVRLHEIGLTPFIPDNLIFLKQVKEWNLIHLAIVFHRTELIEMILNQPTFDRMELRFKIGNRFSALELVDEFIRFQSESPYLFPCAYQLENVSELFK